MKRKIVVLVGLLVVLAVVFLLMFLGKKATGWKGNILLITLDTTRADSLGCYGNAEVKTPNLDKLAANGIRFENCFSPVPLTLPAHCSLFTGKFPIGHGVRNNGSYYLNERENTLAEVLRDQGYQTHAVIAAFVLLSKFGLKQGFERYDDSLDSYKLVNTFKSEITAEEVFNKFVGWFQTRGDKKFFSWVHFYDPHTPYTPPKEFFDITKAENHLIRYRGEVAYMDVYVGKIIDLLEQSGILDETLVVVAGDHGEAFGEHLEFSAHSTFCYRENLRVPLFFYNPKILKQPRVVRDRVCLIDIMPTLLELTGNKPVNGIQGKNLVPLFEGGQFDEPSTLYIESMYGKEEMGWAPLTGIMDGPYKYISLPEPELYHMEDDPAEKNNLARIKSNVSRNLDKKLGKLVLRYSGASGDSKRDLSTNDIQQLKSLGYISAFSGKTAGIVDPKKGILFNNRVKVISRKIKQNKLDEAEKEINTIIQESPEMISYALISQQFSLYLARNQVEKALDALRAGIDRFPDQVNFRTLLCQVLYDNKRYQEVLNQCREIIEIDPNCTWAYLLKGDSFDQLNDPQKALENYNQALKLEPENVSMKIKYGELLIKNNRLDEALDVYNQVLANRDVWNTPKILYQIALFNATHGTLAKAEELMRRIIRLEPGGKYHYMFALILAKNQKFNEALRNMEIAVDRYDDQLGSTEKENALKAIQAWKQNQ